MARQKYQSAPRRAMAQRDNAIGVAVRLNPAPDGRRRLLLSSGRLRVGSRFLHQDDVVQRVTMLVMRAPEHRRRRTR